MSVRKKILQQIDPETGTPQEATWWIADYADGSGRRHQVRFKHKRDAVAHEEKSKVAVRDGKYIVVADVTVADAARLWMSRCEANGMRHRGPVERATLLAIPATRRPAHPAADRQGEAAEADPPGDRGFPRRAAGRSGHVARYGAQGDGVPEVDPQGQQLRPPRRRRDDRHRCPRQAPVGDWPRYSDARRDQPVDRGHGAGRAVSCPATGGGTVWLACLRASRPALVRRRL